MERMEVRFLEEGVEFTDDLVLCGKLKEDLKMMVTCFVGVFRKSVQVRGR